MMAPDSNGNFGPDTADALLLRDGGGGLDANEEVSDSTRCMQLTGQPRWMAQQQDKWRQHAVFAPTRHGNEIRGLTCVVNI